MMSIHENLWSRFFADESGQDLIEYAILTAIVSVASIVVLAAISSKMSEAYATWGQEIQDGRFHPNDPIPPS